MSDSADIKKIAEALDDPFGVGDTASQIPGFDDSAAPPGPAVEEQPALPPPSPAAQSPAAPDPMAPVPGADAEAAKPITINSDLLMAILKLIKTKGYECGSEPGCGKPETVKVDSEEDSKPPKADEPDDDKDGAKEKDGEEEDIEVEESVKTGASVNEEEEKEDKDKEDEEDDDKDDDKENSEKKSPQPSPVDDEEVEEVEDAAEEEIDCTDCQVVVDKLVELSASGEALTLQALPEIEQVCNPDEAAEAEIESGLDAGGPPPEITGDDTVGEAEIRAVDELVNEKWDPNANWLKAKKKAKDKKAPEKNTPEDEVEEHEEEEAKESDKLVGAAAESKKPEPSLAESVARFAEKALGLKVPVKAAKTANGVEFLGEDDAFVKITEAINSEFKTISEGKKKFPVGSMSKYSRTFPVRGGGRLFFVFK